MYMLSFAEIDSLNKGLAVNGAAYCGEPTPDSYDTLQRVTRARVEDALDIESLERWTWADSFDIPAMCSNRPVRLRLTNAFINEPESVIFKDSNGSAIVCTPRVDQRMGVVEVTLPKGSYTVEYVAGFEADANLKILKRLPDWMKGVALAVLRQWCLANNNGSFPKDVRQAAVVIGEMTRAETNSRVFKRYDRPRMDVIWPIGSCMSVGPAPAATDNGSYRAW